MNLSCIVRVTGSILLIAGLLTALPCSASVNDRPVAGWLESVVLQPWGVKLRGKLDTGAKTSSIHAVNIQYFNREGEEWVRFQTFDPHKKTRVLNIERPLIRDVIIKRHRTAHQERPVVALSLCLGDRFTTTEFSLIDRSRFNYPVLLGRRILQQEGILVDANAIFTLKTNRKKCNLIAGSNRPTPLSGMEFSARNK